MTSYLLYFEGQAEDAIEIIEGDIALDPPSEEDDRPVQRDALRNLGKIWQDRKVPYTIHSSIDGTYFSAYKV